MSETEARDRLAQVRTLLAAERTFSAWIRTGLAGVGGGLIIIRLIPFRNVVHQRAAQTIGQLLIIWGAAIFVFALWDYRHTYRTLSLKEVSRPFSWTLAISSGVLLAAALIILLITFRAVIP